MFKSLKNMSDAELHKKRAFFGKFDAFDRKLCSPLSFFSILAASVGLSLLLPAVPHLMLFTLCGAAAISVGAKLAGFAGGDPIDAELKRRHPPVQQEASVAADVASPQVAALPDLSEVFHRGVDNPGTMKALRFRNAKGSLFLGA